MRKIFLLIVMIILVLPSQVNAISLLPAVMEISGSKGSVVTSTLTVLNTKDIEQTYFLNIMKFVASNTGESPVFIPYNEDHSGLPDWIVLPYAQLQVPAHEKREIDYSIVIPADAASGGYYGAITVSQTPSELVESNGAAVDAITAALVLLTVEGDTIEQASLLDFVDRGAKIRSVLSQTFFYRIQNQGNVHVAPQGLITMKDFFGRTVSSIDANILKSRILPSTTREFTVESPELTNGFFRMAYYQMNHFALGPVRAQLHLVYGTNQLVIQGQTTFWYLPWQFLSLIAGMFLIVGAVIKSKKKHPSTHQE